MGSLDTNPETNPPQTINLPIIDISKFDLETGKNTVAAAIKYGFLYVTTSSTPFTKTIVNRQFDLSKQLFDLPGSEKERYHIDETNRGWTGVHNEILDPQRQKRGDWKEAFNIGEFTVDGKPTQKLPDLLQKQTSALLEFETCVRETCNRVLDLIALGLEVRGGERFFSERHTKPSGSTVRLLHYPSVQGAEVEDGIDIRAGAHSDYGSVTLLFQKLGQPGLEIRTPEETWAPVAVVPEGYDDQGSGQPPVLVNLGDLLSYWTKGLLKSTVHRVIFPVGEKKDRYSIACFCHPANDTTLDPVPSKQVEDCELEEGQEVGYGGGATSQKAITAKEHLLNRLAATYAVRKKV